jgi:pyruvate dehydrogenase E1 component alpha subunit
MIAGGTVAGRAKAYGIPGYITDGSNVLEVLEVVREAVEFARGGNGPAIVENETFRYKGHFEGDRQKYRTQDEIHTYKKDRDPIQQFERLLQEDGLLTGNLAEQIRMEITVRIEEAVQFAMDAPLPAPEDALNGLLVNP